jgi:hypothetical protein
MASAVFILSVVRARLQGMSGGVVCAFLLAIPVAQARESARASWFPDQPSTPYFDWTYVPCEGCHPIKPRAEWIAMARLAGLRGVHFLLAPDEANGPAYSYAPKAIVVSPSTLKLEPCHLSFIIGHEMGHIAQRHFDEDVLAISVLSGKPENWTHSGDEAMHLLEDNFGLAIRMSDIWQQQEQEADWVGALLAAQACHCSIEDSALSYLRVDERYGGGVGAAHDTSLNRLHFLQTFAESARRLAPQVSYSGN